MASVRVQNFNSIPGSGMIKRLTVVVPQQEKEGTLKGVNDKSLLEGLLREVWVWRRDDEELRVNKSGRKLTCVGWKGWEGLFPV